jgi:hypothetical protein
MSNKIRIQEALAEVQRKVNEKRAILEAPGDSAFDNYTQDQVDNMIKNNAGAKDKINQKWKEAQARKAAAASSNPSQGSTSSQGTSSSTSSKPSSSTSSAPSSAPGSGFEGKYPAGSVSDKIYKGATDLANSKAAKVAGSTLKYGGAALGVLGAAGDFGSRKMQGQTNTQAGVGTAAGVGSGILGGMAGGALAGAAAGAIGGPAAPVTVPLATLAGGLYGGYKAYQAGGDVADKLTGADKVSKEPEEDKNANVPGPKFGSSTSSTSPSDINANVPGPKFKSNSTDFESGPKKKKVNEALLVAFHRTSNKINR